MRMLLATVALAAVVASPALAQTTRTQSQLRGLNANPNGNPYVYQDSRRRSPNASYDVYDTIGRYIGSDPDPNVRDQLARDPTGSD